MIEIKLLSSFHSNELLPTPSTTAKPLSWKIGLNLFNHGANFATPSLGPTPTPRSYGYENAPAISYRFQLQKEKY